ncbi:MAG TPA: tripartite tricarboxylate transporter TctB family protein [Hydrogenophaga sp.]
MSMKHIEIRDLVAGALMVAVGLFIAAYAGTHYKIGTPSRMGPGFFPVALGLILAGLGVIIALLAFSKSLHALTPPTFALRSVLAIPIAILVFAFLVERAGLIPAALALTFVAAIADKSLKFRRTLLLGIALALISWLVFSVGLQMTLPAFAFLER